MTDDIERYQADIETTSELHRRQVIERITKESERLVEELLSIIYADEVEPRVKLQAIGMLLDRSLPKLGVEHNKSEVVEESRSKKRMREEIAELVKTELNKGEEK